ncbi:MAG: ATP-binding protein [Taibaiella sp.]|jgi:signal transduction histidine kinase/tetratricopeptide (TPR) repeat protein
MKQVILGMVLLIVASCSNKKSVMNPVSQKDSIAVARSWDAIDNMVYTNPDSALMIFAQAAPIYKRYNNAKGLLGYYGKAMEIYTDLRSDTIMGKKYVDSSWQVVHTKGQEGLTYLAFFHEGIYHYLTGNDTLAVQYYLKALKVQPRPIDSNSSFYINSHTALARIHNTQGNDEIASDFYEPVMRYNERQPNTISKIGLFINGSGLANTNSTTGRARRKKYLFTAKAIAESTKDTAADFDLFGNLAIYYEDMDQMDSCAYFAWKARDIALRAPKGYQTNEGPFIILGYLYIDSGNYAGAGRMLQEFDQLEVPFQDVNYETDYYELRYQIGKHEGNMPAALAALEKKALLREKISKDEKKEQLLQHEREMKKAAAATVIMAKNNQIEKHRLYTVLLVIFSILLALVLVVYFRNKKKLETEKWLDIQRRKEHESQKKLFEERSRIAGEMHDDLGSTLTSTIMAIEMIRLKPGEAAPLEMIERSASQLSEQINEIIWNMNIKNDNLKSLIDYILCFASRFLEEASIHLSWKERLPEKNIPVSGHQRRIIYLCVKELINNIVKHAKATIVSLDIIYIQNLLTIEIKDNGLGFCNSNAKTSGSGNGLENIKKRIRSMNGTVTWKDETPGTIVHIMVLLPLP